ncbi:TetR family transcriptional regulator C-terminal domain-containing protein [Cobetia sp. 4B]|uniref:TetR family transcriptional regulator C-terminal domain-containing protein n=1 Tax=Cobetia sp. 4B TaxID=2758724 RepID=UPI001C0571B7|nr:TetR family transcriptional regulator C-terminal domain-containing protein [Cobetia sp. 4B]QWN36393.1 TetR family transcriptional regulator C-terminal domain-containing protein [Cobetia sp. 4B]
MASRRDNNAREDDLIEATLTCIASEGISRTTVRRVAEYAGVSNGLIRFYFEGKDNMLYAAYRRFLERLLSDASDTIEGRELAPHARLKAFLEANLSPPIVTPQTLLLWANFLPLTYGDPRMAEIRREAYRETTELFRHLVEDVLVAEGRQEDEARLQHLTIALNGLVDGLWIEGALRGDSLNVGEMQQIGLDAAVNLLGLSGWETLA